MVLHIPLASLQVWNRYAIPEIVADAFHKRGRAPSSLALGRTSRSLSLSPRFRSSDQRTLTT